MGSYRAGITSDKLSGTFDESSWYQADKGAYYTPYLEGRLRRSQEFIRSRIYELSCLIVKLVKPSLDLIERKIMSMSLGRALVQFDGNR
jgi:hypothetical protein